MSSVLHTSLLLVQIGSAAGIGGLLVLVLVPLVERAARHGGWVAVPTPARWHEGATPHLGGIALVGGLAGGVAVGGGDAALPGLVWMGAGLLFAVGLADDLWGLRPSAKLVAQLGAVALVLASGLRFWPAGPAWAAGPITAFWVLGLINAVNLLDAMDGIAAGVASVAALSLGAGAVLDGRLPLAVVAAALATATMGFLIYNFSPARIFMGDCGSLPLGYLLAALGLGVQQSGGDVPILAAVVMLAVPVSDTLFVSVTRLSRDQSVAEGGTDHTMHRLARLGWSERQVALLFYGAGALCGGVGLVGQVGPSPLFYGLAVGIGGAVLWGGWRLARRTGPGPTGGSGRSPTVEQTPAGKAGRDSETPTPGGPVS